MLIAIIEHRWWVLSLRQKIIISAIVLIVVWALVYGFILRPQKTFIRSNQLKIGVLQTEISQLAKNLKLRQQTVANFTHKTSLNKGPHLDEMITICNAHNVIISSFQFTQVHQAQLNLNGRYTSIVSCINQLTDFWQIEGFDWQSEIMNNVILHLQVRGAALLSADRVKSFRSRIDSSLIIDPFHKKSTSHLALGQISTYRLNQLHLVGIIQQGNQFIAVIADPTGLVYQLKQGMSFGFEQVQVASINATGIVIHDQQKTFKWALSET